MKLLVRHVMTRHVITVRPDTSIDETLALLLRHHISGLPVVDSKNRLLGVITERDLLALLCEGEDERRQRVDQYWTTDVVTVREDDYLPDVAELLMKHPVRRLPVVNGDGKLVGVLARRDLVRFIRDTRRQVQMALEQRRAETAAAGAYDE